MMTTDKPYPIDTRVAIHPATDAWMQGDRFGTVIGYGRARQLEDVRVVPVRVRLDSGRVRLFHPNNVTWEA